MEAVYPGQFWGSGAVGSRIVGVKLGRALIWGGRVGVARSVGVWALDSQYMFELKGMFRLDEPFTYAARAMNVPMVYFKAIIATLKWMRDR